jgi:hypothetical protein
MLLHGGEMLGRTGQYWTVSQGSRYDITENQSCTNEPALHTEFCELQVYYWGRSAILVLSSPHLSKLASF